MSNYKVLKEHSKNPIYRFCRETVRVILHALFRIRVVGNENIPLTGPLIIGSNHIHNFDPPLIGVLIPRYIHYMAKAELFRYTIFSKLLEIIGAFPVHRGGQDKTAIRQAISIPKNGQCLVIFPEGHRSRSGELGKPMPGLAFIAKKANCPIIPTAIIGPYRLFAPLTIRFGQPIHFKETDSNEAIMEILMSSIQELILKGHYINDTQMD